MPSVVNVPSDREDSGTCSFRAYNMHIIVMSSAYCPTFCLEDISDNLAQKAWHQAGESRYRGCHGIG